MTTSPPSSALLRVTGLHKRYTPHQPWVVEDVSFELSPGQILSLVGPSGCGKTTTLRLLAGFEQPDFGRIELAGQTLASAGSDQPRIHLPPEKRGVGIVFQDYALFPHLSVLGNVTFGITQGSRQQRRDKAMTQLQLLDMAAYADRKPQTLSGGQQQRVALARTIAANPKVVLLDEPFSNLDITLRESARRDVRQTLLAQGVAAILVTHDREEAMAMGDHVAVMHQGRIIQQGKPEALYHHPADVFVASFLGGLIQLPAQARGKIADTLLGPVHLARPAQGDIQIALRPQQITLLPATATLVMGKIHQREFRGHAQTLLVHVGDQLIPVLADTNCPHLQGETVSIRVAGEAMVFEI